MLPVRPANIHKLAQISQKLTFQTSSRVYSSEKIPEKNFIRLGDQVKELNTPTCPEKVPKGYAGLNNSLNSQAFLHNLRWLMQKDSLKQDCYLIGSPPGAFRRHLAFSYAEITKREIEYLCLTRDTTESDIKQRREVKNSSVLYENQCAVNAALNGRILIIEGIEKAERNLLPILNNLLENREINLDDGQFMVSPERYDKLKHLNTNMNNLLRVHEDFRVIAIGLPVPKYKGNLLDPPLRSRFQAHLVPYPNYEDFLSYVRSKYENVDPGLIKKFFDFSYSLYAPEMTNIGLVDFPVENLDKIIKIVNNIKNQISPIKEISLVEKIYPFQLLYQNDDSKEKVVWNMLGKFGIEAKSDQCSQSTENELVSVVDKLDSKVVTFKSGSDLFTVEVGKGNSCVNENKSFIMNRYHSSLLVDMFLNHSSGHDFVLIGPTGCGKTELINKFASLLDYSTQSMHLFKDMSARDLIQQRITETNGDTKWLNSPLIEAAINGDLMILDGIHRLKDDTLMSLRRLIQDRELDLLDGRKLIRHDKYDELINTATNDEEKKRIKSRLMRIDPAFKIIGTAEASSLSDNKATIEWLNSEVLNLFLYEKVDPLGLEYEHEILSRKFLLNDKHEQLFEIIRQLKSAAQTDTHLKHVSSLFTLRKLIRMCKKIEKYPNINLGEEILNSCLYKFMPSLNKQILDDFLAKFTFESSNASETVQIPAPIKQKSEKLAKIPDVVFYENKLHSKILNNLYQDFSLGEHLLLIGNQGTGKNKLVDRFLMLTQTPREYLQLHRDTTVHSLTVQPCIKNGVVFYEDSPLVKAIKTGEVLVIDEADKAPLHVTSVLKSLIENGEMILSDGRRIVKNLNGRNSEKYIQMHPDFRMIILANRPGYPFLGNDFFSILGDLLSTHPIDNPDPDSEIQMLRNYAPSLSDEVLKKLISAFGTLRKMSDQGLISYPYSTREIVNVVKHMQKYPDDSLPQVLANVYDFDHFEDQNNLKETFREVMNKHGIPVGASRLSISLSEVQKLPQISSNLDVVTQRVSPSSVELSKFGLSAPFQMESEVFECEHVEKRADYFSELRSTWSLGAKQKLISDLMVKDKRAYVTGVKPLSVVEIDLESSKAKEILVGGYFKGAWRSFYPNFKILNVDSKIILYEESTNQAIQLDFESLTGKKLEFSGGFLGPKISKYFQTQSSQNRLVHFNDKILVQYKSGSSDFTVLNFDTYEDKRIVIDPSLRINNLIVAQR
ncbi:von Willebrand factor A domain-containing 8 [Brachionus plicatilis]|uniref:von Willebrand factor A domain-containing protein 8 n=1 Tax=Brachionus plicatilis TaxID=10195 RepID=A0A3M7QWA7_BRAPC|nr:von Willebrand factor A domain-containing 8 [Brachionus plicatilis]